MKPSLPVFVTVTAAVALAATVAACGPKPAAAPAAPARDTAAENAARRDSIQRESARLAQEAAAARQRLVDDSIARARAAEEKARRDADLARTAITVAIGFEFNRADLRDDAKAALDAKLLILLANTSLTIRVSGHADERGSTEYNLALGTERAAAAKRYLVERGVAPNRIETTSFGEERPVCTDDSEDCWERNRRGEFEITAGSPTER
jgi:peptidoglycan-associated lipoprotein